ncbi:MAG: hypothetical protein IKD89_00300 [Clostridia bacterium]|nr:hypothetical protein [Clostridia bacterium]
MDEILQAEEEQGLAAKGLYISRAEFHDNGDGTCTEKFKTKAVPFERIRRITGYLVGDMTRWNNAKLAEEHDRVKHSLSV